MCVSVCEGVRVCTEQRRTMFILRVNGQRVNIQDCRPTSTSSFSSFWVVFVVFQLKPTPGRHPEKSRPNFFFSRFFDFSINFDEKYVTVIFLPPDVPSDHFG